MKQIKEMKTVGYEARNIHNLKLRIAWRSKVIESHNELVRLWREENRNDMALIKQITQDAI